MKVYRINLLDSVVYKTSKKEVRAWCLRNPGEMQSWDEVDVLEELDRLASELDDAERLVEEHRQVIINHGGEV